jgi:hypothetical protein
MGFGSKKSFELPVSIGNLVYLSNFFKGGNGTPHDVCLLGPIENFINSNEWGVASVDNTFVVFDRSNTLLSLRTDQYFRMSAYI